LCIYKIKERREVFNIMMELPIIVFGFLITSSIAWLVKSIAMATKGHKKEHKVLIDISMLLLKAQIMDMYYRGRQNNGLSNYDKDTVNGLFKIYKESGQNGWLKEVVETINHMDRKEY